MQKATFVVILAMIGTVSARCGQRSLRELYNMRISRLDVYTRPLSSSGGSSKLFHMGTVATLHNGEKWLIHKGNDYGGSGGDTVVTCADNMSAGWSHLKGRSSSSSCTIGKAVRLGGARYNLIMANCIRAANNIFDMC